MAAPTPSTAATAAPVTLAPADCGGATSASDFGSAVSSTTLRGSAISSPQARLMNARQALQRESTSGDGYSRPSMWTGTCGHSGDEVKTSMPSSKATQVSSTFV